MRDHWYPQCASGRGIVDGNVSNLFDCWTSGFIAIDPANPITYLFALAAGELYCDDAGDTCFPSLPEAACVDTDLDGLLDVWETAGLEVTGDGIADLSLPGADPNRLDLFVEVDCLVDDANGDGDATDPVDHHHCPELAAIRSVVQSFADAPVANLDGSVGIQIHIDTGPLYGAGAITAVTGAGGAVGSFGDLGGGGTPIAEGGNLVVDWDGAPGSPATSFYDLKAMSFDPVRAWVYRYSLWAHQTNASAPVDDCTSGWAEAIGCNDFLVTLACGDPDAHGFGVGSVDQQAGTFMHELGHCLGLGHGGSDDVNYKANYLSVMNYSFQFCGVPASPFGPDYLRGGCDFSPLRLADLVETSLDECAGLDSGALGFGPIDWDGDGTLEGVSCAAPNTTNVSADLNFDGSGSTLVSFDDWSNLLFGFQTLSSFANGVSAPTIIDADPATLEIARMQLSESLHPEVVLGVTAPATILPGEELRFGLALANNGRGPALELVFTNIDPVGLVAITAGGALRAREHGALEARFQVPEEACPQDLTNVVSIRYQDIVGVPFNVSGAASSTVLDIVPPNITLVGPPNPALECGIDGYFELGAIAEDRCDPDVSVAISGAPVDTNAVGEYAIEYTAEDDWGNENRAVRRVEVADTTPPIFSLSVSPSRLWPPNHSMVEVTPTFSLRDACDAAPELILVGITSNEPADGPGDGHTEPDIAVMPDGKIFLRAERAGAGSGRIYELTFRAIDASGNATEARARVLVPVRRN